VEYRKKIEELKQKGIFTESQAKKLNSLSKNSEEREKNEDFRMPLGYIGAGLIAVIAGYTLVSMGGEHILAPVEDVGASLNAPISSGISVGNTIVILGLLLITMFYFFLQIYAQAKYTMFWEMSGKIQNLEAENHTQMVMEKELSERLMQLLEEEEVPSVSSVQREDPIIFAMKTIKELKETTKNGKDRAQRMREEAQRSKKLFPNSLGKIIGKLPRF